MRELNALVLRANELRYTAFGKEQEALRVFNEECWVCLRLLSERSPDEMQCNPMQPERLLNISAAR
jgi:hypothetical protein